MPGEYVKVARVSDISPGTVVTIDLPQLSLAICNVNGEFFAIENLCTHDDGPLGEGALMGYRIRCPRHGAFFDIRTGKAMSLPAMMPVESFPVRVQDDDIEVQI